MGGREGVWKDGREISEPTAAEPGVERNAESNAEQVQQVCEVLEMS